MSETMNPELDDADPQADNELTILKNRARMMGITFSNNIGVEALRKRIADRQNGTEADVEQLEAQATEPEVNPLSLPNEAPARPETRAELRERLRKENLRLVRLRITNLDPKKKDLPGEILTVGNDTLGMIKKFVPYGEVTENGYHVPYIIYNMMKARRFLDIRVTKDNRGRERIIQRMVPEFALEELPMLTPKELADLKAAQAAASVGE